MSKKASSTKDIKLANKNVRKNNSARKTKLFSIADVSQAKRGR